MGNTEKVIARFNDGKLLKGSVRDFTRDADVVLLKEAGNSKEHRIPIDQLKAMFFVHSLAGDSARRERKAFGIRENLGRKIYIKFNDGETLLGFIEGEFPWKKGFSLSKPDDNSKGFYVIPVDSESNNIRVFIVATAVRDISIMTSV
jgi:hypothetical protein